MSRSANKVVSKKHQVPRRRVVINSQRVQIKQNKKGKARLVVRWGLMRNCRSVFEEKNARYQGFRLCTVRRGYGWARIYNAGPDAALVGGGLALYLDPGTEGMQPS
jgi:hypothetical protein